MNPAERCGECLLAADEVSTSRERKALAAIQADFVDFLDAGIRLIGQQIDAEAAQDVDMILEGSQLPDDHGIGPSDS
jgi:hypothetical protein